MLGKLIKYEFKSTARTMIPLYVLLLALALINGYGLSVSNGNIPEIFYIIFSMAYFGVVVAIMVFTFVSIVSRFYKNLLTDEGYLMFTLPVKTSQLIASKLIIGLLWSIVSVAVIAIGTLSMIMIGNKLVYGMFNIITSGMSLVTRYTPFNMHFLMIFVILAGISSVIFSLSAIYFSISIGQLSNKHKIFASIGAYMATSIIFSVITSLITDAIIYINGFAGVERFIDSLDLSMTMSSSIGLSSIIVYYLLFAFVFLKATCLILEKKLNLE